MIRTILSIAIISALSAGLSLRAEPTPSKKSTKQSSKTKSSQTPAAAPLKSGWTLTNGVWMHPDGYKLVNGQVVRSGPTTHKAAPKPPTKAEMDAATAPKSNKPKSATEVAAEKEAQRQRNLAPRPAPQTGSHL
jgi:hypothetical protein